MTLEALSSISDLKDVLEEQTKIPKQRMVLTDIWNCHVYNVHENYKSVDDISDNDNTVCYEVPTDLEMINGLFPEITEEQNVKFKLVPVYHQELREGKPSYYSRSGITKKDVGLPLVIKLPTGHSVEVSLVEEYITKMMTPYLQNVEKWNPSNHVMLEMESNDEVNAVDNDMNNMNIRGLDESDDDDDNAPTTKLFEFDEHSSEGDGAPEMIQDTGPEILDEPGAAVEDVEDVQEPELPEEPEEEDEELKYEEESKEIPPSASVPYYFVVLDKYGKNCGECSYASNCEGCHLDSLRDSVIRIPDNDYDSRAIGVRWKLGASKCFNHNAFTTPLEDESVPSDNGQSNDYSGYTPKETVNLSQCIDEFVAEETLGKVLCFLYLMSSSTGNSLCDCKQNDMWYCRQCKEHKCAMKKLDLYTLPSICIIHLKRFTQNGYYREKNGMYSLHFLPSFCVYMIVTVLDWMMLYPSDASVIYPIGGTHDDGLDLSNWLSPRKDKVNAVYDLFAVSIHSGGLGGGHYIANAKNLHNGEWYDYNDSSCSSMNEAEACTDSAYVLFYKKRDGQSMDSIKDLVSSTDDNEAVETLTEQTAQLNVADL